MRIRLTLITDERAAVSLILLEDSPGEIEEYEMPKDQSYYKLEMDVTYREIQEIDDKLRDLRREERYA